MADNWWESASSSSSSRRNRLERGGSPSSSTTGLNSTTTTTANITSFGWPTDIVDIKATARSCLDSVSSVSGNSSINNLFQDHTDDHKLGHLLSDHDHSTTTTAAGGGGGDGGGSGGGMLTSSDPSLQMMGLGLSSQVSLDWNQSLFRGDQNRDTNFRPMIQEDHMSSSNTSGFKQESGMSSSQDQWRSQKMYTGNIEDNSTINRGFSLDHSNSIITCQGLPTSFQMDSYGTLMGSENQPQPQPQQQSSFSNYQSSYGSMNVSTDQLSTSNWSKYPPFLRNSPPKPNNQLHFSNNAPFWNASAAAAPPPMNDGRSNFFPSLQMQLPPSNLDEKPPKNTSEVVKKSSSESSNKRPRNDNSSPLPAFKVRKEKMGDRITALQQLVSPFGKTDTASVLSEAIEYIKFLHEQVGVLSTPYMKNGAPVQHQQIADKSSEEAKQDLRSRGLCLVPVSSTFPMTHETTVDFWTPTFGGTFR